MPAGRPLERIAVLGLGLIGGSLARRLAVRHEVACYDRDPTARRAAAAAGLRTAGTLPAAVAGRDLILVAVPVPALPAVLAEVAAAADPGTIVSDVASVKGPALAAWRSAAQRKADGTNDEKPAAGRVRYVGGHPMAGSELSGFAAADPELFAGAAWVLCLEEDTDLAGWLRLAQLVTGIGGRVVPCTAAGHDAAVARISGLPHLLALTLAQVGAAAGPLALSLAAGSFRDGTRVAGTRAELTAALADGNREQVTAALDEAVGVLAAMRARMLAGESLLPAAEEGRAGYRRWTQQRDPGTEWVLHAADPDLARQLLALGAAGSRVVEVDGPVLRGVRPGGRRGLWPGGQRGSAGHPSLP